MFKGQDLSEGEKDGKNNSYGDLLTLIGDKFFRRLILVAIFGGIDGTGPSDNAVYARDFAKSHVRTMWSGWPNLMSYYVRGPNNMGSETAGLARSMVQTIAPQYRRLAKLHADGKGDKKPPAIILSGYSRGGAAVTYACHLLQAQKIPVHALMLFDAVDRTYTISDSEATVPSNVTYCYHARRDPKAQSRTSFGNCSTGVVGRVKYAEKFFFCTHGGVGGCPWKEAEDNGYIYEGYGGKAAAYGAGALAGPLAPFVGSQLREAQRTNVKLQQDKAGAVASGNWMKANLQVVLSKI
jgi:hypothetical protein